MNRKSIKGRILTTLNTKSNVRLISCLIIHQNEDFRQDNYHDSDERML